jgi:hypothetical protein
MGLSYNGSAGGCAGPRGLQLGTIVLFALEDECDWLVLGPFDADCHGAIRGKCVTFESDRAGLRGGHLQHVAVPSGLALEVFAAVNRGVVLGVGDVAVEEGLSGARIHEIALDDDDAIPIADCHRAGLNDGLAGKIALGGFQCPRAGQSAVIAGEGGARDEEGRHYGSGNYSGRMCLHDFLPGYSLQRDRMCVGNVKSTRGAVRDDGEPGGNAVDNSDFGNECLTIPGRMTICG